jgi:hypothetical protein
MRLPTVHGRRQGRPQAEGDDAGQKFARLVARLESFSAPGSIEGSHRAALDDMDRFAFPLDATYGPSRVAPKLEMAQVYRVLADHFSCCDIERAIEVSLRRSRSLRHIVLMQERWRPGGSNASASARSPWTTPGGWSHHPVSGWLYSDESIMSMLLISGCTTQSRYDFQSYPPPYSVMAKTICRRTMPTRWHGPKRPSRHTRSALVAAKMSS